MHSPYLNISHLTKNYGNFTALEDISLQVEEGEFVCFLGPSGCGKTTLLRSIAGLEQNTSGTIHQAGKEISQLPPQSRDFGIVFQSYALFPNLNVSDNISYGLRNKKLTRKAAQWRASELLQQVEMPGVELKYPAQLSGGQQQRVALARALAMEPGLLLLDEPLSALDARVRAHLRQEICMLQRKLGITTIMVTHDQEEALTMADKIVAMNQGVIAQIGTARQIYQQPNSAFVANFIGCMNMLAVSVKGQQLTFSAGQYLWSKDIASDISNGHLGFRPEQVKVLPPDLRSIPAQSTTGLQIAATVISITFMGASIRLRCLAQGCTIEVELPPSEPYSAKAGSGDKVLLTIEGDKLHFFANPSQQSTDSPAALVTAIIDQPLIQGAI